MKPRERNVTQPGAAKVDGAQRLRKIASELACREVGPGGNVERVLDGLAERWNPILDDAGRRNLVTDVNALVADYLRPIRRSLVLVPPSAERLCQMAEQLSQSKVLAGISRKEPLRRYLLLSILALLSCP